MALHYLFQPFGRPIQGFIPSYFYIAVAHPPQRAGHAIRILAQSLQTLRFGTKKASASRMLRITRNPSYIAGFGIGFNLQAAARFAERANSRKFKVCQSSLQP